MKRITPVLGLVVLAACADTDNPISPDSQMAPLRVESSARTAEGSYIIVLKEGANPRSVAAIAGVNPDHIYTAALTGFLGGAERRPAERTAAQSQRRVRGS